MGDGPPVEDSTVGVKLQGPQYGNICVTEPLQCCGRSGRAMDTADDLVLDALGDRHRRAIVRLLAQRPRPVHELAAGLPISRPAVSRHLRLLKDAGLVTDRPAGNERIYQLHARGIGALQAYIDEVWGEAIARFRLLADNWPGQGGGAGPRP
jgi:DNA-binding transcriptional ArsR family regulator